MKETKNVKEWLNLEYKEGENATLTDLYLKEELLRGELDLKWENFPKLERVWHNYKLRVVNNNNLTIAELLQSKAPEGVFLKTESHVQVLKYVPIKERLQELYPDEVRDGTTELDLTQKGLRGSLDLGDFENLEKLTLNMDCPWNRKSANSNYITSINLTALEKLEELTLINLPRPKKLGELPKLNSLEKLVLKGESDQYPALWEGSLNELENKGTLVELDISYNPNIKTGLEHIEKLEEVKVKGTVYEKSLKSFNGDVKAWKIVVHRDTVSKDKTETIKNITEYLDKSHGYLKFLNEKGYTDRDLVSKIELLEAKNREVLMVG